MTNNQPSDDDGATPKRVLANLVTAIAAIVVIGALLVLLQYVASIGLPRVR